MRGTTKTILLSLTAVIGIVVIATAQQKAALELGKSLFNDPRLGTTGKSCNTCHPGGKGLEKAGSRDDLADVIKGCITVSLKGKALDVDSAEMRSLVLYVKSFGNKKQSPQKPPLGC